MVLQLMNSNGLRKLPAVFTPPYFDVIEIIFVGHLEPERIFTVFGAASVFNFCESQVLQLFVIERNSEQMFRRKPIFLHGCFNTYFFIVVI